MYTEWLNLGDATSGLIPLVWAETNGKVPGVTMSKLPKNVTVGYETYWDCYKGVIKPKLAKLSFRDMTPN